MMGDGDDGDDDDDDTIISYSNANFFTNITPERRAQLIDDIVAFREEMRQIAMSPGESKLLNNNASSRGRRRPWNN